MPSLMRDIKTQMRFALGTLGGRLGLAPRESRARPETPAHLWGVS